MKRFEEVVDKDFIDKYLDQVRPEYHVVDSNGRIQYGVLEKLFFSMNGEEYPNRFVYSLIYGEQALIPSWNVPVRFRGNEDGLYKYCLDKGITWQKIFGNSLDEDILL